MDRYVVRCGKMEFIRPGGKIGFHLSTAARYESAASAAGAALASGEKETEILGIGERAICRTCSKPKAPAGRDLATAAAGSWCTAHECEGYDQEPKPGTLWPGELEGSGER